jgi:hypothetical protein
VRDSETGGHGYSQHGCRAVRGDDGAKPRRVWMPPVWQALSSIFGGVFDRTCVRPLDVAFYDATGRYAVRKAGFTSIQRAASARAPGLNFPALNFEILVAYSSTIAHPGLAAMSWLSPSQDQVTPFDNSPALL